MSPYHYFTPRKHILICFIISAKRRTLTTTLSTDANGTVSASALYKAFGELRSTPSSLGTDYKFTGQREEASLGLYFFVARWLDPSLGRFTSPDSIVPTSTQGTQAWDRYAFVNNNPVRYNDPTGHQGDSTNDQGSTHGCDSSKADCDATYCRDASATNNNQKGPCIYPEPEPQQPAADTNNCIEDFSSCYSFDAIMWGVNISGSEPGWFKTAGLEEVAMFDDGTRATYQYVGEGSSAGAGASASAYVGAVFNLSDPDSYIGPFGSVGITLSIGDVGITAFYFWDSSKSPLSPGITQGFAVGYAPGAQLSAWGSSTIYTENWRSDR